MRRNYFLEFRALPYIDFVTCKYPRMDQIYKEIITKTYVSDLSSLSSISIANFAIILSN
jgi:hypothetical protein